MKKLSFITVFVFLSILFVQAQQAKYVFYFIGDGMGVNQVLGTEMYQPLQEQHLLRETKQKMAH